MIRKFIKIAALALALAGGPVAAQTGPSDGELVAIEILPGWRDAGGTHWAGLRIRLAPGWKTYWRAPGEAGIPPRFNWTASGNVTGIEVLWPRPKLFDQAGMQSIGYEGEVVLPVRLQTVAGGPIRLAADLDIGVCRDVCVPYAARLEAEVPANGRRDAAISAAIAAQPALVPGASAVCSAEPIADGLRLTAEVSGLGAGRIDAAVIETSIPGLWVSKAVLVRSGSRLAVTSDLVPPDARPFAFSRKDLRITLFGAAGVGEIRGCRGG